MQPQRTFAKCVPGDPVPNWWGWGGLAGVYPGTSLVLSSCPCFFADARRDTLLFTVGPQAIDIVGATVVVGVSLSGWISAVLFTTTAVYIPMTVLLAELRMKQRRCAAATDTSAASTPLQSPFPPRSHPPFPLRMHRVVNVLDNEKSGKIADALLNYETVKYFTNERKESDSYRAATDALLVNRGPHHSARGGGGA